MPATDRFLIRSQQIAAKVEVARGTAETLSAAEVKLKPFQSEINPALEPIRFRNDEVSDDIGQAADFVSACAGVLPFGWAFKTSGTVGTPAAVGVYLRGCGLQEYVVHTITAGAPSPGSFAAGSRYTATGGKTGIIEQDYTAGGTLRYIALMGGALANTKLVTVGANTATCSSTDPLHSVRYKPRWTGHENITIQRGI